VTKEGALIFTGKESILVKERKDCW